MTCGPKDSHLDLVRIRAQQHTLGRHHALLPGFIINFYGWPGQETRLFTGEPSRGVVINSGYILMYPGAQIKFDLQRHDWD